MGLPLCTRSIRTLSSNHEPLNFSLGNFSRTSFFAGPDSQYPTTLKKVDLAIVPNDRCQEELRKTRLGQYFILDPSFICAGGQTGMDTCEVRVPVNFCTNLTYIWTTRICHVNLISKVISLNLIHTLMNQPRELNSYLSCYRVMVEVL